jgi:hypothetical protein
MKKLIAMKFLLLVSVLLVATMTTATALTIHSSGDTVYAIGNLDIAGTLYNVDFEAEVFSTLGGETQFWTAFDDALAAANAINLVLNATSLTSLPTGQFCECYDVYFGGSSGELAIRSVSPDFHDNGLWGNNGVESDMEVSMPLVTAWSVAAVPIPAAAYLFASGLGLLDCFRRRING